MALRLPYHDVVTFLTFATKGARYDFRSGSNSPSSHAKHLGRQANEASEVGPAVIRAIVARRLVPSSSGTEWST